MQILIATSGVDKLQAEGLDGSGIVIAEIDTGLVLSCYFLRTDD